MNRPDFQPVVHEFDFDSNDFETNLNSIEHHFSRLSSSLPGTIFLDGTGNSAFKRNRLNRYSYLGAAPIKRFVARFDEPFEFDDIRNLRKEFASKQIPGLPPFQGGLAGFLAYELNTKLERITAAQIDEFQTPLAVIHVYDVVVAYDHLESKGWIISQGWPETDGHTRQNKAEDRLVQFREILFESAADQRSHMTPGQEIIPKSTMNRLASDIELYSDLSRGQFLDMIAKAVEYIHRGDIFQTNLSQRLLTRASCSSLELYRQMRQKNPAPFSCYFDFGDGQIISASPERLVSLSDRQIETRPIKGTRKRTGFPEVDLNVSQELADSEKDRAENVMIVDLMRNDLSKVADVDSVLVEKLCGIESFEKVLHLVSVVQARLRDECDCIDLLEAVFPGGSITGAPKIRAMEIISELEPTARGPYCGSLGYINHNGNMDFNILIRTITAKGGWWQIPVGGGIVSDSDPQAEYEETWTKAIGMLKAVSHQTHQTIKKSNRSEAATAP